MLTDQKTERENRKEMSVRFIAISEGFFFSFSVRIKSSRLAAVGGAVEHVDDTQITAHLIYVFRAGRSDLVAKCIMHKRV